MPRSVGSTGPPAPPAVTYLVLAHRDPAQVARLVRAVTVLSPTAVVVVHWSASAGPFSAALPPAARLVREPVAPRWGHWSLVEAVFRGIEEARRAGDPDWVALVSGSDYPVAPLTPWERWLGHSDAWALLDRRPPAEQPPGSRPHAAQVETHLRYHHDWHWLPRSLLDPPLPPGPLRLWRRIAYRAGRVLEPAAVLRETPDATLLGLRRHGAGLPGGGWPLLRGGQWVALQRRALDELEDPRVLGAREWFRRTLIPDEAFFQTVAGGLGWPVLAGTTSRALFAPGATHPDVLVASHAPALAAPGPPFARKVVPGRSDAFMALMDRRLGLPPPPRSPGPTRTP